MGEKCWGRTTAPWEDYSVPPGWNLEKRAPAKKSETLRKSLFFGRELGKNLKKDEGKMNSREKRRE